jgi:hypothetical protein
MEELEWELVDDTPTPTTTTTQQLQRLVPWRCLSCRMGEHFRGVHVLGIDCECECHSGMGLL